MRPHLIEHSAQPSVRRRDRVRQLQGLTDASDDELMQVEIIGLGYGLHWEAKDADFTVGGLMAGRFGTASYMERERARLRAILETESETQSRHHAA